VDIGPDDDWVNKAAPPIIPNEIAGCPALPTCGSMALLFVRTAKLLGREARME
jgi:hypothetical protein